VPCWQQDDQTSRDSNGIIQVAIDKCHTDVSANLLIRGAKNNERWNGLLLKQEEKIVMEKEKVAMKNGERTS
jgi:hypothetical protein